MVESSLTKVGNMGTQKSLQRIGYEDELVIPNQFFGKKKIVVRIPDNLDPDNVAVLESKLFNHFNNEIDIKYYGDT